MGKYSGLIIIVAAIIALLIFRLLTDRNSRFFPREDRKAWKIYQGVNAVFFVLALVIFYFLARLIKWAWMH